MILVTNYRLKPYLPKAEIKKLMDAFATHGAGPGVSHNYVTADGNQGVTISDTEDVAGSYRNLLNYGEWMEFDSKLMLPIEVAAPLIYDFLG